MAHAPFPPPLVYVWGIPGVPQHLTGAHVFTAEFAQYLAVHHGVTTYRFENANAPRPFMVPVSSPLETLACIASHMPPRIVRQRATHVRPG